MWASEPEFLKMGLTMADLNDEGIIREIREELVALV